jgi:hypothetical protein
MERAELKSKITVAASYFMILGAAFILFSCTSSGNKLKTSAYPELEKASWLLGVWGNSSSTGSAAEIWEKENDSTYTGKSYFLVGTDTISSETIRIEQHGGDLFYIPVVRNQNNNEAVVFILSSSADQQLIFENPGHDFPQKISYTKITGDSLIAEISGMRDGKLNSQRFPMKKIR